MHNQLYKNYNQLKVDFEAVKENINEKVRVEKQKSFNKGLLIGALIASIGWVFSLII